MFKKNLTKTTLPHGSDHRWALNRSILGFKLSWNQKRLTKTFPRRELTWFTKQTLGMYPLGEWAWAMEMNLHTFKSWCFVKEQEACTSKKVHRFTAIVEVKACAVEPFLCLGGGGGGRMISRFHRLKYKLGLWPFWHSFVVWAAHEKTSKKCTGWACFGKSLLASVSA